MSLTSQLNVALIRKLRETLVCLAYCVDMLFMCDPDNRTLQDTRSTGAGIKCLYCTGMARRRLERVN